MWTILLAHSGSGRMDGRLDDVLRKKCGRLEFSQKPRHLRQACQTLWPRGREEGIMLVVFMEIKIPGCGEQPEDL